MLNILFSAQPDLWEEYEAPLRRAFAKHGVDAHLARDHAPADVDYIVFAPNGPVSDFSLYRKTKAVMSLWAGVETVIDNPTLTQPLCRLVDPGLTTGMVEWVVGHTLRYHLGIDDHITKQDGVWRNSTYPPIATQRKVTILGMGALGAACGQALRQLGFPVTGWRRTPKEIANIVCLHGDDGLQNALQGAEVVILLLPQTPETQNILNVQTLNLLAKGAFIINPGRGALINDEALLMALANDQIAHATLDVFREEPLPPEHPFWANPKVTVTPHIASSTRPETACNVIAGNIARGEAGKNFRYLVDRSLGY